MARISRAFALGLLLDPLLVLADPRRDLVGQLAFQPFEQHLLCGLARQPGDFVQLLRFLLDHFFEVFVLVLQAFVAVGDLLLQFVQLFFLAGGFTASARRRPRAFRRGVPARALRRGPRRVRA